MNIWTLHNMDVPLEDAVYFCLLERKDVKSALFRIECAQMKRDSVARKLSGGSTAVSTELLGAWETELKSANKALFKIAQREPLLLERCPFLKNQVQIH